MKNFEYPIDLREYTAQTQVFCSDCGEFHTVYRLKDLDKNRDYIAESYTALQGMFNTNGGN